MKVLCKQDYYGSYYKGPNILFKSGVLYDAEFSVTDFGDYVWKMYNVYYDATQPSVSLYAYEGFNVNIEWKKPGGISHHMAEFSDYFYTTVEQRKIKLQKIRDRT